MVQEHDPPGWISFGLHACDNVIVANGFAPTAGAWGAQAGICLSSSPGCLIERNLILANREGFDFREQTRTTPRIGSRSAVPVWNHDESIRHNLIAFNRDAQVWGWFDVRDNRHLPAPAGQEKPAADSSVSTRPGDIAGPYLAGDRKGQPQGLTLEQLRLRFTENTYCAAPGQAWFHWGVTWGGHKGYAGLRAFQTGLGIDAGSQALDPGFADLVKLDLRLKPEMMKRLEQSYPKPGAPGVVPGTTE